MIDEMLSKMFDTEPELQQLTRLCGWLERGIRRLMNPSGASQLQTMFWVGGTGTYKSFVHRVILEPLFGGRSSDFFGITESRFNEDTFDSPLLVTSDPWKNNGKELSRQLTSFLKGAAAETWVRWEGKNKKAAMLRPIWAVLLIGNETPQALNALPDVFQGDAQDKMLGLRTPGDGGVKLSMPMWEEEEKAAVVARVRAELPAFVNFLLNEFRLPEDLRDERWGQRGWVQPTRAGALGVPLRARPVNLAASQTVTILPRSAARLFRSMTADEFRATGLDLANDAGGTYAIAVCKVGSHSAN